jgi:hypothetical protein
MQIKLTVLTAVPTSRVLRSGDDKGTTKHGVELYCHTGDLVPSKFAVSGFNSDAEAHAFCQKFPNNSVVNLKWTPRDIVWLDSSDIQPVIK